MTNIQFLRLGAVAAVTGAAAQLTAWLLEPDWGGDSSDAIRVVADNRLWNGNRLLDLIGMLLTVGALAVVGISVAESPGSSWSRLGQPFLVLMGALGAVAIVSGATMKQIADTWASEPSGTQSSYLAVFEATVSVTEVAFFCAFLSLGLYLASLAVSILTATVYARWIGWAAAASGVMIVGGNLLSLASDGAFIAVLVGFVVFLTVVVALGVSMWRHAATSASWPLQTAGAGLYGSKMTVRTQQDPGGGGRR